MCGWGWGVTFKQICKQNLEQSRGEHRNTREELLSWGRWRARHPVGWGSEPGAALEERGFQKEADRTAAMSAGAWSFLSETGCCYRGAAEEQYL